MTQDREEADIARWEQLYEKVCDVLENFGTEDSHIAGDYWVHDDYWGFPQIKVYVHDLLLLRRATVEALQRALRGFSEFEIIMAVAVRGAGETWPDMGLTIGETRIADELQRDYFPRDLRSRLWPEG